ncbi:MULTISPECIES: SDR family NAD(P)-dependent oxidoreductase [unclassified Vibrio]|uniref:SDR family NAD(P)-dependent oxidoreductase n=1 Tax=unclassified Vibrio TaxID=2614977 RepID=UPI0010BD57BD|nr:SDR family oxidoreductase [Vibrio sp. F13]TKG30319.1 SDR family oxidoreductase [Vibrio sp. F13]
MNNKWVLITGALGGIGTALVTCFSKAGYRVVAADRAKLTQKLPDGCVFIELDLAKVANSEEYSREIYKKIEVITEGSGLSCIINNAAVQILESSTVLSRQSWDASFDINLKAAFFLVQEFLPELKRNEGSVVNISSIHATQTKRDFVAYATSKAALSSLTRNMVLDLGDQVRVNAIEPAAIATDMLKAGFEGKEKQFKQLESYHPMKRIGTPEEVAKLALFLASDDAGFVQGACISASGGISGSLSDPG